MAQSGSSGVIVSHPAVIAEIPSYSTEYRQTFMPGISVFLPGGL
jgi:hypothetical protein